jgi:hypothetical protein
MKKRPTYRHSSHALSRRDVLRMGSLIGPGLIAFPSLFARAAWAQTTSAFDYYISPSGSDSNAGTQASPWAITSLNTKQSVYGGKRVGLLDGTYNVGSMMTQNRDVPALGLNGGTSSAPTVIGVVNSGAVTITANNGSYGGTGGNNTCAMMGHKSTAAQQGYLTIDGLKFTGGSYQVIEIGNYDFSGPIVPGVTIQNCEFTANNCASTPLAQGGNCAQISIYRNSGTALRNNYHHDNVGIFGVGSADHFSALYQWQSSGTLIEYCTLVNTGNFHGKEGGNQGTTIRYCYIDVTPFSSGQNRSGIQGFDGAPTAGLTQSSSFHNNVILYSYIALDLQDELNEGGWTTPLTIYNNTFVASSSWATGIDYYEQTSGSRLLRFYNNLYFDNGLSSSGGYGYVLANVDAFGLIDYNIYGGHPSWSSVTPGQVNSDGVARYSSLGAWQGSLGGSTGADAHSQSAVATFSNAGQNAAQYQVTSGIAFGSGRTGGTSSGTAVNIGAWDGIATQIGASSGTTTIPVAPVLSVS